MTAKKKTTKTKHTIAAKTTTTKVKAAKKPPTPYYVEDTKQVQFRLSSWTSRIGTLIEKLEHVPGRRIWLNDALNFKSNKPLFAWLTTCGMLGSHVTKDGVPISIIKRFVNDGVTPDWVN